VISFGGVLGGGARLHLGFQAISILGKRGLDVAPRGDVHNHRG
jgi:hypothetical protein